MTRDLVGFAPILTAPVAGRWWTTFQGDPLTPVAEYGAQHLVLQDATANLDLSDPINTAALAGDQAGDAAVIWQTDDVVYATFVDAQGSARPLSPVGPSSGFVPSAIASPQAAIGDEGIAVAWLERPPFDVLSFTKSTSGRVVISTTSISGAVTIRG